jgi:hypothetical protein
VHQRQRLGSVTREICSEGTAGMSRIKIFSGISLITMSVLMLELGLTRIFSATMYYHFAFMAISLGLFGSGASGVFIYVIQRTLATGRTDHWLGLASQLFALTNVIALYVILTHPLALLAGGMRTYYTLALIYTATALPFFFAGCVVTLAITIGLRRISIVFICSTWLERRLAVCCLSLYSISPVQST